MRGFTDERIDRFGAAASRALAGKPSLAAERILRAQAAIAAVLAGYTGQWRDVPCGDCPNGRKLCAEGDCIREPKNQAGAVNLPGKPDTIGHGSVQAWSIGELFPAVITKVETYDSPMAYDLWVIWRATFSVHASEPVRYDRYTEEFFRRPLSERLIRTEHCVSYPGQPLARFAGPQSYDDAAAYARRCKRVDAEVELFGRGY